MNVGTVRIFPEKEPAAKRVLKPLSWLADIDFVAHLIFENNVLVSVLGEQGSGKTTFAALLHADLSLQITPCSITASFQFDRGAFLQQLSILLGIESESSLSSFVAQTNAKKTHVILIIDNAHYLPADFIEDILNMLQQQGNSGYFHVCLVSEFSLVPTLNALAQGAFTDMIHSIEIGSLTEGETKMYVTQNVLSHPGAENIITDERVAQFQLLTEGRIEKINRQMVDFFSYKPSKTLSSVWWFRPVGLAVGVFLLAAIGIAYLGLSQDSQSPPTQFVEIQPQSLPSLQIEPVLSSAIPYYTIAATRYILQATSVRREGLPPSDEEDNALNESLVVMDKVIVAPKVLHLHPKKNVVAIKKSTAVAAMGAPQRVTKTAVIKPAIEQSRFTIQILASRNMAMLKQFAQAHHINERTQVRRTQHQGAVWYVLTFGEYTQRQVAKQAVEHLPKDIAHFNPWVRSIADLKAG